MEEGAEVGVEEVGTGWEWVGEDTGEGAFHGAREGVEGLEDMEARVEDMEVRGEDTEVRVEGSGEARWVGEDMEVTGEIDSNRIECYLFNYLFFPINTDLFY